MDKNLEFYRNKKILITGHTGFKGSWLTLFLNQLDAHVMGIALESKTTDDFFVVNNIDELCISRIFDIANYNQLKATITEFKPDLIFHLAAQPLVRFSYTNPLETYQTNVMGTANLLESLKYLDKKCAVVIITTDKVYENKEWHHPYRESDRLGGNDPYSSSKACSEIVVSSFRNSFFHPDQNARHQKSIATARAGNVIGGGDWSDDRLVPDIVKAIRKGTEIIIRNPEAIRPWQHVLDPLYGYLLLGAHLYENPKKFGGAWNFGPYPEEVLKVEEVVKAAIRILEEGNYRIEKEENAPHEATLLKLDISKALNILHWKPRVKTEEAIALTLDWYKELARNRNNIEKYSKNTIIEYLQRIMK